MQIVTLEQIKWELNVTHSAKDAQLTAWGTDAENEVLGYIGLGDYPELLVALADKHGETEVPEYRLASLKKAICHLVKCRFQGVDIKPSDPFVMGLLITYRLPSFSSGTTE